MPRLDVPRPGKARESMRNFLEEYAKHASLNIGQALQGVRYLLSHPDQDTRARRGTMKHAAGSMRLRAKRIGGDLFFAVLPPHWHHTPEELRVMTRTPIARWFQYGYCAWRFTEAGEPKTDLTGVDRRWDPRCLCTPANPMRSVRSDQI